MRTLRRFAAFWYDFIVGDDWTIAVGVLVALALTAIIVHTRVEAWWLLPLAVLVVLGISLTRAARHRR